MVCGVDIENVDILNRLFAQVRPDVATNCIGLVKQLAEVDDPLAAFRSTLCYHTDWPDCVGLRAHVSSICVRVASMPAPKVRIVKMFEALRRPYGG